MLILKFVSLFIAAVGAALALFGEPRHNGHLTKFGKAALALVISGFVVAIALELVTTNSQTKEMSIKSGWDDTLNQNLFEVLLNVTLQDEMPLEKFLKFIGDMKVTLGTFSGSEDGEIIERILSIKNLKLDQNPEKSIFITSCSKNNQVIGHGLGITLQKLTLRVDPKGRREKVWDTPRNGYWGEPNAKASGFFATIPWAKIGFDSNISTVRDIHKIKKMSIILPLNCEKESIFMMNLLILTSDLEAFRLDLKHLQFRESNGRKVAGIEGADLLKKFRDDFQVQGGPSPMRFFSN